MLDTIEKLREAARNRSMVSFVRLGLAEEFQTIGVLCEVTDSNMLPGTSDEWGVRVTFRVRDNAYHWWIATSSLGMWGDHSDMQIIESDHNRANMLRLVLTTIY